METFARGMLNLALSPIMIVSGLAQGLAFLPYTLGVRLNELNAALLRANAVSLDDSYKATFGVPMNHPAVHQTTGDVHGQEALYGRFKPEAILEANRAFRRLLVSQGMPEDRARDYALVGNYAHAWSRGHILVAVVRRHTGEQPLRVTAKQTGIVTTSQDKVVATLMAMAAEALKADRRAPDYCQAEHRWLAGDTTTVLHESMEKVRRALPG